tara:strand:+ start:1199 stop:2449 length:1251 start_codon:yes stop_codon:yes gene_type:complete
MTGLLSKIIIPIVKRSSKLSRDYPDLTLKSRKEGLAEKFLDEHNYEKYSPSSGDTKPTKPHYVEQDNGKITAYTPLGGTKNKFEQKSFNNPTLKSLRNWMGYSAGGKVMQKYNEGGSLMTPPEREEYVFGSLAKLGTKLTKAISKISPEKAMQVAEVALATTLAVGAPYAANEAYKAVTGRKLEEKNKEAFEKKLETAINKEEETFMFKGEQYNTYKKRKGKAEGGSLMMPPEMMEEESIQEPVMDVPEDTYQSEDPIEVAASQESDEVIEQDQMEMVLGQALDSEEQQYLMNALEGDEQLSQIFDKVLTTASEFSGEGAVEGLGDGTSDSIPARLSDGEFVMTKKATDQIGSDNLQVMMDDAERAYDGGEMRKDLYGGGMLSNTGTDDLDNDSNNTDEEIRKLMGLRANQAPSLR